MTRRKTHLEFAHHLLLHALALGFRGLFQPLASCAPGRWVIRALCRRPRADAFTLLCMRLQPRTRVLALSRAHMHVHPAG